MEDWDKIYAVDRMQEYIVSHAQEEITIQALSRVAGYSPWHAIRIFKELTGKTPFEFLRAVRLTKAAEALRDSDKKVLDIALDNGFDSHDGFTRAFSKYFGLTPRRYHRERPPVQYFTYTPISFYYHFVKNLKNRSDCSMERPKVSATVTATLMERPRRKVILLRSKQATDYFSFCEEMGCEWHGILDSIPEKLDAPALLTLPPSLITEGTSATAAGVEVPAEYDKPLPPGYEMVELPPSTFLIFQGMPFEREEDFCQAIEIVFEAMENYRPEQYGLAFAQDKGPMYNFGASAETGAKMAVPVSVVK